jgi:hypothetical protein
VVRLGFVISISGILSATGHPMYTRLPVSKTAVELHVYVNAEPVALTLSAMRIFAGIVLCFVHLPVLGIAHKHNIIRRRRSESKWE